MLNLYPDYKIARKRAKEYLGKNAKLLKSTRKNKKYMIKDDNGKLIHFGEMGYEDYTKHKDAS